MNRREGPVLGFRPFKAVGSLVAYAAHVSRGLVLLGHAGRPLLQIRLYAVQIGRKLLGPLLFSIQLSHQADGLIGILIQHLVASRNHHHRNPCGILQVVRLAGVMAGQHNHIRVCRDNLLGVVGAVIAHDGQIREQLIIYIIISSGNGLLLLIVLHSHHQILGLQIAGVAQRPHIQAYDALHCLRYFHLAARAVCQEPRARICFCSQSSLPGAFRRCLICLICLICRPLSASGSSRQHTESQKACKYFLSRHSSCLLFVLCAAGPPPSSRGIPVSSGAVSHLNQKEYSIPPERPASLPGG